MAIPTSTKVYGAVCVTVAILAGAFVAAGTYTRSETVSGWLVPHGGMIRLSSRNGGVIEKVFVNEGDVVRTGQPIAQIRLISALSGGADAAEAVDRVLKSQEEAIVERREAAERKLISEQTDLAPKIEKLREELAQERLQVGLQKQQVELAEADVGRFERLVKQGAMSARNLDSSQSSLLSAKQTLTQQQSNALLTEAQIQDAKTRLHAIPADLATVVSNGSSEMADVKQRRIQASAQSIDVVVSAIAGRVLTLPSDVGQTVTPGEAVAVLSPGSKGLEVELYVPSHAVGFIKPGQQIKVMYQAFPHEKYGASNAMVISVSRTILAPSEVAIPGISSQQPVFRVRAALADQFQNAYGQHLPLQPGMLLNASIIFDRRTLFQWLLDPVYAVQR